MSANQLDTKEVVLKWVANIVIVVAAVATAFDIHPWNKVLFLVGSLLWTVVGIMWRQPSLWTLNAFCAILYIIGLSK
jgi:hypothetical protein